MEASQHALTAKSSDDIGSLQKTKVELEEQVKSLEEKLQEKNEVFILRHSQNHVICIVSGMYQAGRKAKRFWIYGGKLI